jgi:hypothetical protein
MLIGAVTCFLVLYSMDYGVLRLRISKSGEAFGTVQVRRYYAIQEKANRVEYIFDKEANQTCVRALFPHLGFPPCWYLSRHPEQRVDE